MAPGLTSVAHADLWLRAGAFHTAVLTGLGKMYSWGASDEGQLGLGHTDFRAAPHLVQALQDKHARATNRLRLLPLFLPAWPLPALAPARVAVAALDICDYLITVVCCASA